jgi:CHAT domain-containing protein
VKASIDIQKSLHAHNAETDSAENIHVKIGINAGEILVDRDHIAGDVVNVASRIQGQAGPDQVLVAKSVFDDVCGSEGIICMVHGKVQVKGKPQPLELYRVVWQEEDIAPSHDAKVRAHEAAPEKKVKASYTVLNLEITQDEDRLKISADEQSAGETTTIRHYEEIPISTERIGALCREVVETLNNVNRRGRLTQEGLVKLREVGQVFRDELFTLGVKEKVKETKAGHIMLVLDDQLVHVPWELLYDGQQFLCQRFSIGRLVRTRQTILGTRSRLLGRPFKMLILADPGGDLKGAYEEGIEIRDLLGRYKDFVSVSMQSDEITTNFIRGKIRDFDIVHFAGHAEYDPAKPVDSGWRLGDGILKAGDITRLAGTASMPALIFSNACQSARSEGWLIHEHFQDEIFGLANAFMLAGVKHYIGTFWEILDEPSSRFALECYKEALSGKTIGEAIRQARLTLIREYGEETIVWASYLLYGDPTFNYLEQVMEAEAEEIEDPFSAAALEGEVRAREEVIDLDERESEKKRWPWLGLGVAILALVLVLLFGYPGFLKQDTEKYERAALTHYHAGNYDKALGACETLENKNPDVCLVYLIRGHVYLRQGKLDEAQAAYRHAFSASKGTEAQKAEALIGLGRIASLRNQLDTALNFYQRASGIDPQGKVGYLSQAVVLERLGRYDDALNLLEKAQKVAPEDQALAAMTNQTRKRATLARDQQKQERINKLVQELLETMKSPPRALPSDGWTSPPLTLWIMDFQTQGYSLQEGEERVLVSGISEQLLEQNRVQLVERALLDRLLEELKLGTSELIDRSTALSLGRILAARLILTGQVVYSGPQTQVSLRLIETETGRISGAVNESFGSAVPLSSLTEQLSEALVEKVEKLYPLRGEITEVKGKEVTLNIGQKAGVVEGDGFKVMVGNQVLEVISTQPDSCLARITKGEQLPQQGMRVEALAKNP